jgi:L-2-hydroxyglutarate oxidase LhgO
MSSGRVDVVVVGGGLVGLATAHRLLEADPSLAVTVVEKEAAVAVHQSGRNSGVLHSGIYYRPGSLRAELCTSGKRALEAYADERGIAIRRLGKVVVAVEEAEVPRLQTLLERGTANGVEGLELIGPDRLREREPNVTGLRALLVPGTAVIDYRAVAERLADDVRAAGGRVRLGEEVLTVGGHVGDRVVSTSADEIPCRVVVACAGLQADRLAARLGYGRTYRIVPFRGTFHPLIRGGDGLVNGLVYPVPDPALPFLGVHFTPQTDGSVRIGPNAVLALSREGRGRWSVSPRDCASWLPDPAFWRMARSHWRSGLHEVRRELSRRTFLHEYRRYVPALERRHLGRPFFGTRAQLLGRDGGLFDDFALTEAPGRVVLLNAPSPAATACLSIGDRLADRARRQLAAA